MCSFYSKPSQTKLERCDCTKVVNKQQRLQCYWIQHIPNWNWKNLAELLDWYFFHQFIAKGSEEIETSFVVYITVYIPVYSIKQLKKKNLASTYFSPFIQIYRRLLATGKQMRIWIRNTLLFSLQICGFAIFRLEHQGNYESADGSWRWCWWLHYCVFLAPKLPVFWIRILWFRIRIQLFRLNSEYQSGSRVSMTKNWRKCTADKKIWYFFYRKTAIYLSLGLHKGRPNYRRCLQP